MHQISPLRVAGFEVRMDVKIEMPALRETMQEAPAFKWFYKRSV